LFSVYLENMPPLLVLNSLPKPLFSLTLVFHPLDVDDTPFLSSEIFFNFFFFTLCGCLSSCCSNPVPSRPLPIVNDQYLVFPYLLICCSLYLLPHSSVFFFDPRFSKYLLDFLERFHSAAVCSVDSSPWCFHVTFLHD